MDEETTILLEDLDYALNLLDKCNEILDEMENT